MNSKLKSGLIAAALLVAVLHLPYLAFGIQRELMRVFEIGGYVAIALIMTLSWLAMKEERDRRGGAISFFGAFFTGLGVTAVAAFIFGLATVAFFMILGDALPDALYDYNLQAMQSLDAPQAIRDQRIREMEQMKPLFYSVTFQAAVACATVFVIGLVQSLLGALVISRRRGSAPRKVQPSSS